MGKPNIELILTQFKNCVDACESERLLCLEDRKFYFIAGKQWSENLKSQFEHKPKLEVNKVHLSVIKVINEYRNNRINVVFNPIDDTDNTLADNAAMLFRADEKKSASTDAYDLAFEEAVSGGMGAWRLRNVYEDEDDDNNDTQRILIEPIPDADVSVFFDPSAKKYDKSDAQYCFLLTTRQADEFKEEYKIDTGAWSEEITSYWLNGNLVRIAEYYYLSTKEEEFEIWEDIVGNKQKYLKDSLDAVDKKQMKVVGSKLISTKKVKRKVVKKLIMSGDAILDDIDCAGKCIPIIPVYGKRAIIEGKECMQGIVRIARDAQQLKNMMISKLGEISATSPNEIPIFTPEQVNGHSTMWENNNVANYPYMLINPVTQADGSTHPVGALDYTKPAQVPPALSALLALSEQDIKDVLGNQQNAESADPNISGRAIELVQNRLDMQTTGYLSNMSKSVRRSAQVWMSMAGDVYVEQGRKIRVYNSDESTSTLILKNNGLDEAGADVIENDFTNVNFDVEVSIGATTSTRRQAVVNTLSTLLPLTTDQQTQAVITSMIMMNIEGEGMQEVRSYFRDKLVRMGAVKPTKEEQAKLQAEQANQKPDANVVYLQAAAEEATANAMNAQAAAELKINQAAKTQAETVKIMQDIDVSKQDQALNIIAAIDKPMQQIQPIAPIQPSAVSVEGKPPALRNTGELNTLEGIKNVQQQ